MKSVEKSTQLGVNSEHAIRMGGPANNPRFFGDNTAETRASIGASLGGGWSAGWNDGNSWSVRSGNPWFTRGGASNNGAIAGITSFNGYDNGGVFSTVSHRTILSGY